MSACKGLKAVWQRASVASLSRDGCLYWRLRLEAPDLPEAAPGQFAMLGTQSAGLANPDPLLPRPISILGAGPGWQEFLFKVFGRGTSLISSLRPGDEISLLTPLGKTFSQEASPHPFLMGGGVGIPPLHWLSRELSEQAITHRVVFGFGTVAEIPETLLAELAQEPELCTLDGSRGFHGNPVDYLRGEQGHANMRVQACGPTPMLEALQGAVRPGDLLELSLEERMACGVGVCRGCVVPVKRGDDWAYATVCRQGPVFDAAELAEVPHD
jgi:dihydroorotate dehydrogenase electron transfer subunit